MNGDNIDAPTSMELALSELVNSLRNQVNNLTQERNQFKQMLTAIVYSQSKVEIPEVNMHAKLPGFYVLKSGFTMNLILLREDDELFQGKFGQLMKDLSNGPNTASE